MQFSDLWLGRGRSPVGRHASSIDFLFFVPFNLLIMTMMDTIGHHPRPDGQYDLARMNPFDEGSHDDDAGGNPFDSAEAQSADSGQNDMNPFGEEDGEVRSLERSSGNKRFSLPSKASAKTPVVSIPGHDEKV